MRSTGLSVRPLAGSEMAAAKLSMPICISSTPDIRGFRDRYMELWMKSAVNAMHYQRMAHSGETGLEHVVFHGGHLKTLMGIIYDEE